MSKLLEKWPWFTIAFVVIVIDQATKLWALATFEPYEAWPVTGFLNFTLAYNTGAAFSFLTSSGEWHRWFFTSFAILMSIVLSVWLTRTKPRERLQPWALSLVLGGALGNLIDRFLHGHVIDFIDVHYQNHHWPVFNIADSAICIGVVLLAAHLIKE